MESVCRLENLSAHKINRRPSLGRCLDKLDDLLVRGVDPIALQCIGIFEGRGEAQMELAIAGQKIATGLKREDFRDLGRQSLQLGFQENRVFFGGTPLGTFLETKKDKVNEHEGLSF